jgi:hypothetical protein
MDAEEELLPQNDGCNILYTRSYSLLDSIAFNRKRTAQVLKF